MLSKIFGSSEFAIPKSYRRIFNPKDLIFVMAFSYQILDQGAVHFVTFTVHQWVDVFTRDIYREKITESLRHCQIHKGLEIFSWVLMTNHCHLILRAKEENLSDIIRDFKKFTAKSLFSLIKENPLESRREWLSKMFSIENRIWFWEEGYHGEEIYSREFFAQKSNYIHLNPVRAGFVEKEEEYIWSSAADFYGIRKGKLEIEVFG
jgi:putative transposase